jgi:uncharacterized protein (TIGR02444 family)
VSLWDRAGGAYAAPGAEAACLRLQDQFGQSVSYLLWAAWAAAEGRPVDGPLVARAAAYASQYEAQVLRPLRAARRTADGEQRTALKARELAAERRLLETLEAMTPAPAGAPLGLADALGRAAAVWPTPAPWEDMDLLMRIFAEPGSC